MMRAVMATMVAAYVVLSTGCSCDCTVCCDTDGSGTEYCAVSEGVARQDCEEANGPKGCWSVCE